MIRLVQGMEEFRSLKGTCNELADYSRSPLLRFEWLDCWARFYLDRAVLKAVVVESRNSVTAIAPFVSAGSSPRNRLEMLGSTILCGPRGFLYKDENALEELLEGIIEFRMPLSLKGIPSSSIEAFMLESALKKHDKHYYVKREFVPWLPLIGSWKDFEAGLPLAGKPDRRSRSGRPIGSQHFTFEVGMQPPGELDLCLDEIFRLAEETETRKHRSNLLLSEQCRFFLKEYMAAAEESGQLKLGLMKKEDECIAMIIGIEYSDRLWLLGVIWRDGWGDYSPGVLLMNEMIHYAFRNQLESVEFLDSDDSWYRQWARNVRDLSTYWIYDSAAEAALSMGREVTKSAMNFIQSGIARSLGRNVFRS